MVAEALEKPLVVVPITKVTTTIDVEVTNAVLEANGFHHEDDCDAEELAETIADDQMKLSDWHDQNHGLTLWLSCEQAPCCLLSEDFRTLA